MRVSGRVPYFIPETPDYIQRKRVNSQTRCTQEREGILLDEHRTDTAWNAESATGELVLYSPEFASEIVVHTIFSKSESLSSPSVTEQRVASRTTSIDAGA